MRNCPKFQEKYIPLLEILVTNHADQESFSGLVTLITTISDQYSSSKSFGKLLLHVTTCVGRHFPVIESSLSHIVASHKSIWKGKIQKCFENYQQLSQFLSQSFRWRLKISFTPKTFLYDFFINKSNGMYSVVLSIWTIIYDSL